MGTYLGRHQFQERYIYVLTADGDDETKNESSKRVILLQHITINEFKERYNTIQPKKQI